MKRTLFPWLLYLLAPVSTALQAADSRPGYEIYGWLDPDAHDRSAGLPIRSNLPPWKDILALRQLDQSGGGRFAISRWTARAPEKPAPRRQQTPATPN